MLITIIKRKLLNNMSSKNSSFFGRSWNLNTRGEVEMTLVICVLEIVYLFLWMGSGKGIFLLVALAIFGWWIVEMRREAIRHSEKIEEETINQLEEITHNRRVVSDDCLKALLLDEYSKTFYFAERKDVESNFDFKDFNFDEIYECAIVENGRIVLHISRGGIQGWSLIDDKTRDLLINQEVEDEEEYEEDDLVESLGLKIIVDDLASPMIEFKLFEEERGLEKDSEEYREYSTTCKNWYRKFGVIIKRGSKEKVEVNNWAHN